MSLPKSLLLKHSCVYAKRGGVAAYLIVWIGLCLRRSVPAVRVLAIAVDDVHSTTRTRTPGTLLKHKPIQTIRYAATPPRLAYTQLWLSNSDFGKDIVTP